MLAKIMIDKHEFIGEVRPSLDGYGYDAKIGDMIICNISEEYIFFIH